MPYKNYYIKDGVYIFGLFRRKKEESSEQPNHARSDENENKTSALDEARDSLAEMEAFLCKIKDQELFSNLLTFIAYYFYILEFYTNHMDKIISVKELLLFKYIDMIKGILVNFDERTASQKQKEELVNTLATMNQKLYTTIKNIKSQEELNLNVDLKTIQDLIRSDF